MLDAAAILMRELHERSMTGLVKRSGGNGGLFVIFLIFNVTLCLPFLLFFFYTLAQIIPTLAVAADHDTHGYDQVPLSDLYSDPPLPNVEGPQSGFFSPSLGIRPMLSWILHPPPEVQHQDFHLEALSSRPPGAEPPHHRLASLVRRLSPMLFWIFSQSTSLRARFRSLILFRGLSIFAPLTIFETFVGVVGTAFFPIGIIPQILLPLLLVQLYTLWTHMVLTCPSSTPKRQRMPPFMPTLRATGPSLALFLFAKSLWRFALFAVFMLSDLRKGGDLHPKHLGALILAGTVVEVIALIPTHMVLTRVQTSLLPADEETVVPIDEALRQGDAVGMVEAFRTFGLRAWGRLTIIYAQVFAVMLVGGGVLLVVDFLLFMIVALLGIL